MNKFILVPKEQFEKLKENQTSDSDGSMISEIRLDNKNESPIEGKETEESDKIIKRQDSPPEGDKNIKRQDPSPGLPNHYLGVDKPNISNYDRDRAVGSLSGRRGGNRDPEWVRF